MKLLFISPCFTWKRLLWEKKKLQIASLTSAAGNCFSTNLPRQGSLNANRRHQWSVTRYQLTKSIWAGVWPIRRCVPGDRRGRQTGPRLVSFLLVSALLRGGCQLPVFRGSTPGAESNIYSAFDRRQREPLCLSAHSAFSLTSRQLTSSVLITRTCGAANPKAGR